MRLDRIELIRFGHFSARQIDLTPRDPDFHLVYGDNEAGKSTLLRGISALFFGVPARTPDVHSCKGSELRLGATISSGGKIFSFRRRKGTTGTLLSPQDAQIEEASLAVFLKELDHERFEQFFGLNHQRLREGGEELLHGKGDVGSALFQAAGLLGLRGLLEGIDSEAKELFSPRSRGKTIGNALEEYKHCRAETRRLAISAVVVKDKQAAIDRVKQTQESLKSEAQALQQDLVKLGRVARNKPDVARLQDLRAVLCGFDSVPDLPRDARKTRDEAATLLASAAGQVHSLKVQIAQRKERIQTLPASATFKLHAKDIEELNSGISDYVRAVSDRPKRVAEQEDAVRLAQGEWSEIWRKRPIKDADELKGPYSQKGDILVLMTAHARLTAELEQANEQLANSQLELERIDGDLERHPEPGDPSVLIAAIEQAKLLGDTDSAVARLESDIKRMTVETKRDLDALDLWSGSLDGLEALTVPLAATLDRYGREWDDIEGKRQELRTRLFHVQDTIRKVQAERDRLIGKVGNAGEKELADARARRDNVWRLIRDTAFDKTLPEKDARRQSGSSAPLPESFEEHLRLADQIADLRFTHAKDVAIHDRLTRDFETTCAEQRIVEQQLADLNGTEAEVRGRWISEWKGLGMQPLLPAEMRDWMQLRQGILERQSRRREMEAELHLLRERIRAAAVQIENCLKNLGSLVTAEAHSLGVLISVAQSLARQSEDGRRAVADLRKRKESLSIEKQSARFQDCKNKLARWQDKWLPLVKALLLPADSTPSKVGEALVVLERVFEHLKEADRLQHRVTRIGDNIEEFEKKVSRLIAAIAPPLGALAPQVAAADLHARYVEAGKAETERDTLEAENVADELLIADYSGQIEAATITLRQLRKLAQTDNDLDLDRIIGQSEQKTEKQDEYNRIASGLIERNAVSDLHQVEDEACSYELDLLNAEIARKEGRQRSLQDELITTGSEHGRLLQDFESLEANEESTLQSQGAEEALARIRSAVKQYVRLTVASEVLTRAIDSYRQKHQGPVLSRASELFSTLTCGEHRGLTTAFGADDRPVLVAIRKSGEQVEVEGLSDGTRDQLYLALRLAGIEHHIETVMPCPVIFDDILINSDDQRSEAVLRVIGDLAKRTQVLFFTHHRHLLALGNEAGAQVHELKELANIATA